MKISGFTIVRNAVKYNYPFIESMLSILPICDEFIVNLGDSDDDTKEMILSMRDPKIRIIERTWNMGQGEEVLGEETNVALAECRGDWAFYLQSDEMVHEDDLSKLLKVMKDNVDNDDVDALRFSWLHFYGSYFRYRVDRGWFQKQDRIVKNNGEVESFDGAYGFRRKDGKELRRKNTGCFIYHYGWVHPPEVMTQRRVNAENIGFTELTDEERKENYSYGDLNRFPVYFGTHPAVMKEKVQHHPLSQKDKKEIHRKYWWYPPKILKIRYKTGRRIKHKIE